MRTYFNIESVFILLHTGLDIPLGSGIKVEKLLVINDIKIVDKIVLFQKGKIKWSEQCNNRCRSIYSKKAKYLLFINISVVYSDKTNMGAVTIY